MVRVLVLLGLPVVLMGALLLCMHQAAPAIDPGGVPAVNSITPNAGSETDILNAVRKLSSDNMAERELARKELLEFSNASPDQRREVIDALVHAMEATLVGELTHNSFALWREGSRLLGELKAVESLDFLIRNLDLTDGLFSASMNHQPAVLGIIGIGSPAVPKLSVALRESPDREKRLAAAFCLASIGGDLANDALRDALRSESDPCLHRFIKLSLITFAEKESKRASKSSDIRADAKAKLEWLKAYFACGDE